MKRLIVKGTRHESALAAAARGIPLVFSSELAQTTIGYTNASAETLNAWLIESLTPPFEPGSLLLWTEVSETESETFSFLFRLCCQSETASDAPEPGPKARQHETQSPGAPESREDQSPIEHPEPGLMTAIGTEARAVLTSIFGLPNAAPRKGEQPWNTDRLMFVDDTRDGLPICYWQPK